MKTYTLGLLQASAYRALKGFTLSQLRPFGITAFEWACIGLLYERTSGYTTTALAEALSVKKPFITKTVRKLETKKLLTKVSDIQSDQRIFHIQLTSAGKALVPKVEKHLRTESALVFKGVNRLKLLAYVQILEHINKKLNNYTSQIPPQ